MIEARHGEVTPFSVVISVGRDDGAMSAGKPKAFAKLLFLIVIVFLLFLEKDKLDVEAKMEKYRNLQLVV